MTDQVDSVNVVTNDAGDAISAIDYLPYGETWYAEGDTGFSPKYNSQELDKESGLYFFNSRHYDPEIARFETADSVVHGEYLVVGWNRYTYVHGNPVMYKDPTGHAAEESTGNKAGDGEKYWEQSKERQAELRRAAEEKVDAILQKAKDDKSFTYQSDQLGIKRVTQFVGGNTQGCRVASLALMNSYYMGKRMQSGGDLQKFWQAGIDNDFITDPSGKVVKPAYVAKPKELAQMGAAKDFGALKTLGSTYYPTKDSDIREVMIQLELKKPILTNFGESHAEVVQGYEIKNGRVRLNLVDPGGNDDKILDAKSGKAYHIADGQEIWSNNLDGSKRRVTSYQYFGK